MSLIGSVRAIKFGVLSPDTIRKISVAEIQTAETYDEDGVPIPTGVMDPRLGTLEPGQRCKTCGNTYLGCPGHFGHIELPVPVIHVGFVKEIERLLNATCRACGRVKLSEEEIGKLKQEIEKMKESGRTLRQVFYKKSQKAMQTMECPHCKEKQYKVELEKPTTFMEVMENQERIRLTPSQVRQRLERIPDEDLKLLEIDPKVSRPEWMVLQALPVPPVYVRPSITLESGFRSEDDLTHKLVDILRVVQRLRESQAAGAPLPVITELADLLQYHVTSYINNEAVGIAPSMHRSGRVLKTLAQRLKGKEGRFRLNLSGKRVDFSARTVISPDPNLGINEVGVPVEIAMQLTVPEKVTQWNIDKLRRLVRNGPDKYPGAKYIVRPDGKRIRLKFAQNLDELAELLGTGYVVERHLMDGDIVLFNRQPSLHRMSIMAHVVKVLPYKTLRLNLAVCVPYNADFDGDEMNLHVPQSEEAQAEARLLLLVQNNIVSPRYGAPIIGPIRDFLTSLYLLTKDDTYLTKKDVSYLLASMDYDGDLPEPELREPEPMWSGKQVFSLILPKGFNHRFTPSYSKDEEVVIEDGKLVKGAIDRNAVGTEKANSILHRIALEMGIEEARRFIDRLVRLSNAYLSLRGFTMGIEDLETSQDVKEEAKKALKEMIVEYNRIKQLYAKGKITERFPGTPEQAFEIAIHSLVSEARDKAGQIVRSKIPQESNALIMAKTGARGSTLNIDQMSAVVGQQTVRRERPSKGYGERLLSFFKRGDLSPVAKGFVYSSFLAGLNPIEFFYQAMGGRDGLIDTAVRTQQSGYMQRRLINALESLYVDYDGTVRTADDGKIVQFLYGEDGVDPSKTYHGKVADPKLLIERVMRGRNFQGPKTDEEWVKEVSSRYAGKMPESMLKEIEAALVKEGIPQDAAEEVFEEAYKAYMAAKVEPGDAVGIVTAQSIGEPGTQLTLRTFHFAGVREQSILIGLPRLIEIVDARRTPSTPTMKIYLDEEHKVSKSKAQKVAKDIQFTSLEEVTTDVSVSYDKGKVIIKLDEEAMREKGVTMKDIEANLKKHIDFKDSKTGTIHLKPAEEEDLLKFKDRVLKSKVKGIKRIIRAWIKQEGEEFVIYTEGSNLKEVLQVEGVDPLRVETNNIHEIAEVLGIEAARNAIVKEIKNVLGEQGLDVDIRHALLLADMMTISGTVKQIGRHGVVKLKSSVLARAAFEISVQTLLDAAARGETDQLKGNVERILIGKEVPVGTGLVSLLMLHPSTTDGGGRSGYKEGA